MTTNLPQLGELWGWSATEVRAVKQSPDGEEVVVIARHRLPDHAWLKNRWWLTRRHGTWKVYGLENLDVPNRLSMLMGLALQKAPTADEVARLQRIAQASRSINEAIMASIRQDVEGGEEALAEHAATTLPPRMKAIRQLAHGMLLFQKQQHLEAIARFDRAAALHADMPLLDLFRGMSYNWLGNWAEGSSTSTPTAACSATRPTCCSTAATPCAAWAGSPRRRPTTARRSTTTRRTRRRSSA